MDRGKEFADLLRSSRRPGDSRLVTNIIPRKKPSEGSNTYICNALMDAIRLTFAMMRENESSYTALRGGMEDTERDALDSTIRAFVGDCNDRIEYVKEKMLSDGSSQANLDALAHHKGMVLVLLESLDRLSQYFQTFKAFRVKQAVGDTSRYASQGHSSVGHEPSHTCPQEEDNDLGEPNFAGLTPEEQAQFDQENQILQQELDSKLEQLRNAEREMHMVTSMCELTSRKILEQAQEIDALYDTVVKAVEDIGVYDAFQP